VSALTSSQQDAHASFKLTAMVGWKKALSWAVKMSLLGSVLSLQYK
jgi:hypothetical protein